MTQIPSPDPSVQVTPVDKAIRQLLDIVKLIVADDDLHDLEIEFLTVWLAENSDVARLWPGSAVTRAIETVLADGHVSADERTYLITTLKRLVSEDAGTPNAMLPLDDQTRIVLRDAVVCLTGEFLQGTHAACERLLEKAGAWPVKTVSNNVHYLVVGTHFSAERIDAPEGQLIRNALALQQDGHAISIVSERRWLESLDAPGETAGSHV